MGPSDLRSARPERCAGRATRPTARTTRPRAGIVGGGAAAVVAAGATGGGAGRPSMAWIEATAARGDRRVGRRRRPRWRRAGGGRVSTGRSGPCRHEPDQAGLPQLEEPLRARLDFLGQLLLLSPETESASTRPDVRVLRRSKRATAARSPARRVVLPSPPPPPRGGLGLALGHQRRPLFTIGSGDPDQADILHARLVHRILRTEDLGGDAIPRARLTAACSRRSGPERGGCPGDWPAPSRSWLARRPAGYTAAG